MMMMIIIFVALRYMMMITVVMMIPFVLEQWLMCCDISVPVPIQAHLILHLFDLIARVVDEMTPAREFTIIDAKFRWILFDNACATQGEEQQS